jgi:hypothetical protein
MKMGTRWLLKRAHKVRYEGLLDQFMLQSRRWTTSETSGRDDVRRRKI